MHEKSGFKIWFAIFLPLIFSYFYVLNGDFLGDDIARILFNPELKSFFSSLSGGLADRPLLMIYVKIIVQFFGASTIPFRIIGLALHSLVAWHLYLFLLELNTDSKSKNKQAVAFFSAILFALHPLHNQVLTTAIQTGVLMSGLFGLISIRYFYKYAFSPTKENRFPSLYYYLLGLLSKPNLSFIPLYFLINSEKLKEPSAKKVTYLASFFLMLLIPTFFYFGLRKNIQDDTLSPLSYFLVQGEVLFTYFKLMAIPYNFHFLYDFATPDLSGLSINWLFLAVHALIIYLGNRLLKNRILYMLLVGFYLSFLPESGFFPIRHLAFEHRTYFPMIFLFLFIGTFLINWRPNEDLKKGLKLATIGLSSFFILLNQNRNIEIKRYGSWALDTLEHSNSYHYSNFYFSYLLARAGYYEELQPLLKNYTGLYKNQNYDVLVLLVEFFKDKGNKWTYFSKMRDFLNQPTLLDFPRYFINKAVIEEFSNGNDTVQDLILVEDTLADEMKILQAKKDVHQTALSNFQSLGLHLIGSFADEYRKRNLLSYLRTKTYLTVYFDQSFKELLSELENALAQQPDEQSLKEFLFLVRTKLASKVTTAGG